MSAPPEATPVLEDVGDGRLELVEFVPLELQHDALSYAEGTEIWRRYEKLVAVEFPSPRTHFQWRLTSLGAVGFLPLADGLSIVLKPKVELQSVFAMLEWAYDLDLQTFGGLLGCKSVDDFFARIANILARRVMERARRGLHRAYTAHEEDLPYVRGEIDLRRAVTRPWNVRLDCRFDEHTADIDDNRILAWTLHQMARTGAALGPAIGNVRTAHQVLRGAVTTMPILASDCTGRVYGRLNDDYAPMHALCRFLLDTVGPTHERGDSSMIPFVIDMARLFERFVFRWMKANLSADLAVTAQETVWTSNLGSPKFEADLVIRDASGRPLAVLDTKYKAHQSPATADIQQVVAYATALGCENAYLIYPQDLTRPLDDRVGGINVRSASFSLSGDLDAAGRRLLTDLRLTSTNDSAAHSDA